MATANTEHHVWAEKFDQATRTHQIQDDENAWRAVTGILITIVSIGVMLAAMSVWLCSL